MDPELKLEHRAWQNIVHDWPGDIKDKQWDALIASIQLWGERLVALRNLSCAESRHGLLKKAFMKYDATHGDNTTEN